VERPEGLSPCALFATFPVWLGSSILSPVDKWPCSLNPNWGTVSHMGCCAITKNQIVWRTSQAQAQGWHIRIC
jgi:hypothetical protein